MNVPPFVCRDCTHTHTHTRERAHTCSTDTLVLLFSTNGCAPSPTKVFCCVSVLELKNQRDTELHSVSERLICPLVKRCVVAAVGRERSIHRKTFLHAVLRRVCVCVCVCVCLCVSECEFKRN